ncbi:MAG: sulfite exporter TauE/SafE family protein [Gammaproteobacteria bacterium]|jgi:uncharacterized membrane protein YfcA
MDAGIAMLVVQVLLFYTVAYLYSCVGLGGGSAYTALLVIFGVNALAIPLVALTLNICVTTVGSYHFIRNRHARLRLVLPFLVSSIPMAYLGGSLQLPKHVFYWILLISLLLVAVRIIFWRGAQLPLHLTQAARIAVSLAAGSLLGLVAGIAGIGGGVYLIPLILLLGLGNEKEAAAAAAVFVWLNSASGLASRLQYNAIDITEYLPLILAVIIGGAMGSFMGSFRYSSAAMQKALGVIVLIAIMLLARRLLLP